MDGLTKINLLLILTFLLLTSIPRKAGAIQVFSVGTDVRKFTFTLIDGKKIKMSDYLGKCVIIEFWADYCQTCTKFMTTLEEFHADGRFPDIKYIGLVCEWGVSYERAINYLDYYKITFPQIWIAKKSKQFAPAEGKKDKLVSTMEYSLPKRVFINKQGIVIVEDREKMDNEANIKTWLKKIIAKCSEGEHLM